MDGGLSQNPSTEAEVNNMTFTAYEKAVGLDCGTRGSEPPSSELF